MKREKETGTDISRRRGDDSYAVLLTEVSELLREARHASARSVNSIMATTYWAIGRRIVEEEQRGRARAGYGKELIAKLSHDLTARFGRGFGAVNLIQMRRFYLLWTQDRIFQTLSEKSSGAILQTSSAESPTRTPLLDPRDIATALNLPWSHYVRLLSVQNHEARRFYEEEALRGGWTVRQLARQIESQFYERTALSRNKASMLSKGRVARPEDSVTADEEVKDPLVLEFLGLRDEYSEADAGQMHLYLNYAGEHWVNEGENPPVGIILCAAKGESLVRYATDRLPNKVLVRKYMMALPDEKLIAAEIAKTRKMLESGGAEVAARISQAVGREGRISFNLRSNSSTI
jgi:hypothetical protein